MTAVADGRGWVVPAELDNVVVWDTTGDEPRIQRTGVYVVCSGFQCDAPMRALLTRSVGIAAEKGCDACGLLSAKGNWNASKYMG